MAREERQSRHRKAVPGFWARTHLFRWVVVLLAIAWAVYEFGALEKLGLEEASVSNFLSGKSHPEQATYTRLAVGVPIADQFSSYQDVSSVQKVLSEGGYRDVALSTRRAVESPEYPSYRFETLRVPNYVHLGQKGQLSLQFFNARLYQAEFVPSDVEAYARKQRALGMQRDRNARREKVEGNLRIASTVDLAVSKVGQHLGTEAFVLWQDLRLIAQRDDWDRDFGSIPKKMISG